MAEFIEKKSAIEQFKSVAEQQTIIHDLNRRRFEFKDIVEVIGRIPPADVRPVKRGRWIVRTDSEGKTYGACSCCGYKQYAGHLKYCPECGADSRR